MTRRSERAARRAQTAPPPMSPEQAENLAKQQWFYRIMKSQHRRYWEQFSRLKRFKMALMVTTAITGISLP